jgi:hypothetical protein
MALTKVTSGLLANDSVTNPAIGDNAVSLDEMAHGTDGSLISYDANGAPIHISPGTSGHVLTSAGAGAVPAFAAPTTTLYRNGEVIEVLSLVCNGETQTVLSGTYTAPDVTAAQLMTTTLADLTGSEIAYTPPSGTTRVIYRFSFVASYVDAGAIGDFPLFLDSDEVLHARSGTSGYYTEAQHHVEWTFRIGGSNDTDTGRVASWGSAKTIKIQAREHTSSYEFKVHETVSWAGVGGNHLSVPRITIEAIA